MMLSQDNLNHIASLENYKIGDMERYKLERIASYINDQKPYTSIYQSPNHHVTSDDSNSKGTSSVIILDPTTFEPESKSKRRPNSIKELKEDYNDDDYSLFSASISQVMARKYQLDKEANKTVNSEPHVLVSNTSTSRKKRRVYDDYSVHIHNYENQSPPASTTHYHDHTSHHEHQTYSKNLQHHRRERLSDGKGSDHLFHCDKTTKSPYTKTNGFHLLHKFHSPNLEVDRITIPHGDRKRPKLGLFNKGKSSSKATGAVPDLIFSESKFLEHSRRSEQGATTDAKSHSRISSDYFPPIKNRNLVSKYFQKESQNRNDDITSGEMGHSSCDNPSSHHHNNNVRSRSIFNQKTGAVHLTHRNQGQKFNLLPPSNNHHDHSKNLPKETTATNKIRDKYQKKTRCITSTSVKSERHVKRDTTNRDTISLLSSSNESIERILKECKDAPQIPLSNHKHQKGDQSYSHKRLYERPNQCAYNDTTTGHSHYFHNISQVPSYSRLKTPISGATKTTLSNSIQKSLFEEKPLIDDAGISQPPLNHDLSGDNSGSLYENITPTLPILDEYEDDTSQPFKTYMYDDENEDFQIDMREGTPQHYGKIFNNDLLEDWQIENSIITFSDEDEDSRNTRSGYIDNKNKVDDMLNFWKNQYKRSL